MMMNNHAIALFKISSRAANDAQENIRKFAKDHDIDIIAFIGVHDKGELSSLLHAQSLFAAKKVSMILIDSYKTIAVPLKYGADFWASCYSYAISLVSIEDDITLGPAIWGIFNKILIGNMAKEHEARSYKIKHSLSLSKQKGVRLGGRAFGCSPQELIIIQQISKLHKSGFSLKKICDLLSVNNIKTMTNKKWHPTTVKRIIERANCLKEGDVYGK